jgi:hypothetical protein
METKKCLACGEEKTTDQYYRYQKKCKRCYNLYYQQKWREKNKGRRWHPRIPDEHIPPGVDLIKWYDAYRRYGISLEEYGKLVARTQCDICKEPIDGRSRNIDHCHKTGKIRGVLCKHCNVGLGAFRDNPHVMMTAIAYLHYS